MKDEKTTSSIYDITIRMFILFLIVVWCLLIMLPFANIILWGFILAIALMPLQAFLTKKMKGRAKLASTIIVLVFLAILMVPSMMFFDSIIDSVKEIKTSYQAGTLTIPQPSEKVKSWPIIGEKIYDTWSSSSFELKKIIIKYKEQLGDIGRKIANGVLGATSGMLQLMVSLIIAGILLVTGGIGESARKFFRKIAGSKGDEYADIVKMTVGNVVKGVLGVAIIQSFLIGAGFFLADVPYAGLWTLLVLIFAILQLPAAAIVIPVIAYLFSEMNTLPAVLFTIYLAIAGLSDNILKPILLGKGAPVPMLVIFIGVIGGFMFSGFIGLFTGAIVMSLGYKLFLGWLNSPEVSD